MRDCSHCKMNPENMDLYEEYYDFSSENLAFLERKFQNLQIKQYSEIPKAGADATIIEEEEDNEDDWEDCSDEESENETEILEEKPKEIQEKKAGEKTQNKNEKFVLVDGYWRPLKQKLLTTKFQQSQISRNEKGEMVLPNGDILGHRKYAKYYKQNMHDLVRRKEELIFALTCRAQRENSGTRELVAGGKISTALNR